MSVDLNAIGAAIAAKFAAIDGIRGAGVDDLEGLPVLPWVTVLSPTLDISDEPPSNEPLTWVFPCVLFVSAEGGPSRTQRRLRELVPAVVVAWRKERKLGQEAVQDSHLTGGTPDFVPQGEGSLPVYKFDITVQTRENVTRSST